MESLIACRRTNQTSEIVDITTCQPLCKWSRPLSETRADIEPYYFVGIRCTQGSPPEPSYACLSQIKVWQVEPSYLPTLP